MCKNQLILFLWGSMSWPRYKKRFHHIASWIITVDDYWLLVFLCNTIV